MERRQYLQIPGPTNIPDRILRSLSKPIINHRGSEFEDLVRVCIDGLKSVFKSKNDVLIFPSSGSGALESAIVNMFSQGDTILAASHGLFSERVAIIAENYGVNVIRVNKEWGKAIKDADLREILTKDADHKIKGVCLPQNETTSGITNDIESISKLLKELNHPALLIVDAVSSLACLPFETDKWDVDLVISASQKGFMLPPGLSFVCISEKAWAKRETSLLPKWYWDYNAAKEKMKNYQMPYTPPTSLLFGLKEALDIIEEEGLTKIWDRHNFIGTLTREAIKSIGLELFAEEGYESDTVTAIKMPENIKYQDFAKNLKDKFNVVIGGGLGDLQGKIFRIGHLGSIHLMEIYSILGAVELTLYQLGYDLELGTSSRRISELILRKG